MLETPTTASTGESVLAGEALVRVLRRQGVKAIFSSPGSEWPAVWDTLVAPPADGDAPIRFYNTRHESLAIAAAVGYQKATGELVVVILHSTVGPLQGAMALQMARRDGVPVVVMSGDSHTWGMDPSFDPGSQWLRNLTETGGTARAMAGLVKWSDQVANVWQLGEMVQQACRAAIAPPVGPSYLAVPLEVLLDRVPVSALPSASVPWPRYVPDAGTLDRFAEALARAKRPVIITEEAGRDPENVGRLVKLAELLGAAVLESLTPAFVNFPTDHGLHQGFQAAPVLKDADVVLVLGARGPWHPPTLQSQITAPVLLADEDPAKLNYPMWPYRVDEYASGSLAATLDGLRGRIEASPPPKADVEERTARWAERHHRLHQTWREEAETVRDRVPIDPRWLCKELGEMLPPDVVITEETTTTRVFLLRHFPRSRPGSYATRMTGGLGVGLSSAIGLKIAYPDRPVVAVIGDGAFNYNPVLPALGCMQEYGVPVLTVIANNGSYASMKSTHAKLIPDGWARQTNRWLGGPIAPPPDYAVVAGAFGGHGERVERPDEIRPAFQRALDAVQSGKPAILDVVIEPGDLRGR